MKLVQNHLLCYRVSVAEEPALNVTPCMQCPFFVQPGIAKGAFVLWFSLVGFSLFDLR